MKGDKFKVGSIVVFYSDNGAIVVQVEEDQGNHTVFSGRVVYSESSRTKVGYSNWSWNVDLFRLVDEKETVRFNVEPMDLMIQALDRLAIEEQKPKKKLSLIERYGKA